MILRRITEHVRAQNWFAVGIDFVIVVVGVFIGLQVQEWSVERAERDRLTSQLNSFRTELILARDDFETRRLYYEERVAAAAELRARLAGQGPELTEDDFNRLTFSTLRNSSLDLVFPSFEELLSSESISLITDETLRNLLFRWENQRENIRSSDESIERFRDAAVVPVFSETVALGNALKTDERYADMGATRRFDFDLERIRANLAFDNAVTLRQGNSEQQLNLLAELKSISEELISALEDTTP